MSRQRARHGLHGVMRAVRRCSAPTSARTIDLLLVGLPSRAMVRDPPTTRTMVHLAILVSGIPRSRHLVGPAGLFGSVVTAHAVNLLRAPRIGERTEGRALGPCRRRCPRPCASGAPGRSGDRPRHPLEPVPQRESLSGSQAPRPPRQLRRSAEPVMRPRDPPGSDERRALRAPVRRRSVDRRARSIPWRRRCRRSDGPASRRDA